MRLTTTLLAAGLIGLGTFTASAQGRIGIIDLRKVFDGYYKTKAASESLKQQGAEYDKEMDVLAADHRKANEEYRKLLEEANNMAVSSDERDRRKKAAESKLRELQEVEQRVAQLRATASATMEEKERRLRENIVGEIRGIINARAKAKGYSMVLDIAGDSLSKIPVVLYTNGENDLTDEVLAQLNATAPSTPAPTTPRK